MLRHHLRCFCFALLALSLSLSPSFFHQKCTIQSWVGNERRRSQLSPSEVLVFSEGDNDPPAFAFERFLVRPMVTGALIGTWFAPNRVEDRSVQKWSTRYQCGQIISVVLWVVRPWTVAWCRQQPPDSGTLFDLNILGEIVMFFWCQYALCKLSLMRLKVYQGQERYVWLATTFFRIFLGLLIACSCLAGVNLAMTGSMSTSALFNLALCVLAGALLAFIAFQAASFQGLRAAGKEAAEQAVNEGAESVHVSEARFTTMALAFSALTTVCAIGAALASIPLPEVVALAIVAQVFGSMDAISSALLVLASTSNEALGDMISFGSLKQVAKLQQRRRTWLLEERLSAVAMTQSGPDLAVATLFHGIEPAALLELAKSRFRCLTWRTLKAHKDVFTNGGTLATVGAGSAELHRLATSCALAACDVFLSHSWRDNGQVKWRALFKWAQVFKQENRRKPLLWIDKFCIDQTRIEDDLRCLPLFLGGCNTLLIISGETYPTRLWCLLEVFVYMSMQVVDERRKTPHMIFLGDDEKERADVRSAWLECDASNGECHAAEDRQRILHVMSRMSGGIEAFNTYMRKCARSLEIASEMGNLPKLSMDAEANDESMFMASQLSAVYGVQTFHDCALAV